MAADSRLAGHRRRHRSTNATIDEDLRHARRPAGAGRPGTRPAATGSRVEQARIDQFAQATGDHQWIHVDPARAAAGPFGTTIAHGFLTLSLLPMTASALRDRRRAHGRQLRAEPGALHGAGAAWAAACAGASSCWLTSRSKAARSWRWRPRSSAKVRQAGLRGRIGRGATPEAGDRGATPPAGARPGRGTHRIATERSPGSR